MKYSHPLKQPTDKTCLHTCLAMIVDESVEYVIDWFDDYSPLCAEDAIIFLVHHGIYSSVYTEFGKGCKLTNEDEISFNLPLKDRPALLTVKSERFPDKLHSVFWDGKKVHDPSPKVSKPRDIDTYEILEYWPLLMTQQRIDSIIK